jgi:hypothetical protein
MLPDLAVRSKFTKQTRSISPVASRNTDDEPADKPTQKLETPYAKRKLRYISVTNNLVLATRKLKELINAI